MPSTLLSVARRAAFFLFALTLLSACDSTGDGDDDDGGGPGAPNAVAGPDQSVDVGTRVTLDASASTDSDGDALSYAWAFVTTPAGSTADLSSASGATVTFTPDMAGAYVARVTVSDGTSSDTDDVAITAVQTACVDFDENVTSDRTLAAGRYCVPSNERITVSGAALTLSPGVRIDFGSGAGLDISNDGALLSQGTASQPVTLQGAQPTAGFWRGVVIFSNDTRNRLSHTTIAHGGGVRNNFLSEAANLALDNGTRVEITNSTLRDGAAFGLVADSGARLPGFASNTFSGNTNAGVQINFTAATQLDAASAFATNGDAYVSVIDTDITSDATLRALDAPYRIDGRPTVDGALLTIEAGARLLFAAGAELLVDSDGALDVAGTAAAPVTLLGEQATPGYWRGITVFSTDNRNRMAYATVAHGGGIRNNFLNAAANLAIDGGDRMTVTNSTFRDGAGFGIHGDPGAGLPGFAANTFSDNAEAGVQVDFPAATQLDAASAYAANGDAYVSVTDTDVTSDATLMALDAPYRIAGRPVVDGALLTIAPGARLLFAAGAELQTASDGAIRAVGTAGARIEFTGEQPTPGYWRGITIFSNDTRNVMDFVTISHGGGIRNNFINEPANLAIDSGDRMSITNSTISNSAGWGIQVDGGGGLTQTGNTFSGNALGNVNQD